MSLFKKQKLELSEFKDLMANLRGHLSNKELLDYIAEKLYLAERNRTFTYLSSDGADVLDTKNGDTFMIRIGEDYIETFLTCWNNHHREKREIKFFGDVIAVKYDEATDYVYASSGIHSNTERKAKVEVYLNDLLFCVKEMESSTESSLDVLRSSTKVSETFINEKREAVKKEITAGDEDAFDKNGTSYYYSSEYQAPPFTTVGCDQTVFIYGMSEINEETYKRFLED